MLNKIIIDTDPGGDDIFALLWLQSLIKQGFAELIAVTTAQGNVDAKTTFICASQVLSLGKLEQVELGRGVAFQEAEIADAAYIHGVDGMGGLSQTLPPAKHDFSTAPASDDLIIDKLNKHPGEITLIAIAPLTNLAAAEIKSPGILKKAKEIIVMGGAFQVPGNVTSHAEFNIAFNVKAAKKVFSSRNDIIVLPLDITKQLVFTPYMAEEIKKINPQNPLAEFIFKLSEFMTKNTLFYRETSGKPGFLVHDAATIAYLFYPETLFLRRAKVEIETQGEFSKGQTILDDRHFAKKNLNSWVALQVDAVNLLAILVEDLKYLLIIKPPT